MKLQDWTLAAVVTATAVAAAAAEDAGDEDNSFSVLSNLTTSGIPLSSEEYDYHDDETDTYYYQASRVLSSTHFQSYNHFAFQPYVANGFIGARIPNLGSGFSYDQNENTTSEYLSNGWPLFNPRYAGAFVSGFYDAQPNTTGTNFPELLDAGGYESVISAIPQWTILNIVAEINGTTYVLDPQNMDERGSISDYRQTLEMSTGVVTTTYTWLNSVNVNYTIYAHQKIETLGVAQLQVSVDEDAALDSLYLNDTLDFNTAQRCTLKKLGADSNTTLYITVSPDGIDYKTATVYSSTKFSVEDLESVLDENDDSVSSITELPIGKTTIVTKYVGIASDDLFSTNSCSKVFSTAKKTSKDAAKTGYAKLMTSHKAAWKDLWGDARVTVDEDPYLTLAAEASMYHLLANTRSTNDNATAALAVSGLSSDSYGGMVFWDMDLWMLPALLAFNPENARSLARYRSYLQPQSRANAEYYGYSGAVHSWTSGRFGNCTGTGPCVDYEYHINVDICFSFWKLYLSGALTEDDLAEYAWPVFKDTADFFVEYVKYNETLGQYTTHNLTDPDEYANFKNNAAFTNAAIAQEMKWTILIAKHLGYHIDARWSDVMQNMYIATSENDITLEFDTMTGSAIIKQADVVLIDYIDDQDGFFARDLDYDKTRAANDLTFYSYRQSSNGPAMTWPAYLGVSETLNDYGCGYHSYLLKSVKPYLRFPFAQMSEQNSDDYDSNGGTHPAFPFLTGHGGVLQSYFFGFLGMKYTFSMDGDTIRRMLHLDPVYLPRFPGNFTIEGFKYLDESIDIVIDSSNCEIGNTNYSSYEGCAATFTSNGLQSESIMIDVDNRNPEPGLHILKPNSSVSIPLFVPYQSLDDSLTECKADTDEVSTGMVGDILDAIVDGDNATIWQAANKSENAMVMIALDADTTFSRGTIIWGDRPAKEFSVSTLNDTASEFVTAMDLQTVEITSPFNEEDNEEVKLKVLNYTNFELSKNYTARYVVLNVFGTADDDEDTSGAKIAEFSVFE